MLKPVKLLALMLIILNGPFLFAQGNVQEDWVRHYSSGRAKAVELSTAVAVDSFGNVYVAGESLGSGTGFDYVVIKYDQSGNEQWIARYNGPGNEEDEIVAIVVDQTGNVYVTGESVGKNEMCDFATIKYDSDGNQLWVARFDGRAHLEDHATAIAVDAAGNVYVTGASMNSGGWFPNPDYTTIKYNSQGVLQWTAFYNGPGNSFDEPMAIALDPEGNVYITGASWGSCSNFCLRSTFMDYATIKYDNKGIEQWVARYDGPASKMDIAVALALDSSKNVYVSGMSEGIGTKIDFATIKYDPAGTEQWVARYNNPANTQDDVADMVVDDQGNVYVTGTIGAEIHNPNSNYATIKYATDGTEEWVSIFDGAGHQWDRASALALDQQGNVYVTGQSVGVNKVADFATVKYNPGGKLQWVISYSHTTNSSDQASDIVLDPRGNVYVTGTSAIDLTDSKQTTIKYRQQNLPNQSMVALTGKDFAEYRLSQNFPNPFNATTTIEFQVPKTDRVALTIYNALGQQIAVLLQQELPTGRYQVKWEASQAESGIYYYRFQVGSFIETRKLVLIR